MTLTCVTLEEHLLTYLLTILAYLGVPWCQGSLQKLLAEKLTSSHSKITSFTVIDG